MRSPEFWNRRYLQSPILYEGRSLFMSRNAVNIHQVIPVSIDVRHFVQAADFFLERIVKEEGIWDMQNDDDKALACLRFVVSHLQYTPDKDLYGVNEVWQYPNESLVLGRGDCDDGAILLASLMRNAGIPAYKVKVCAGWVVAGENAPLGGHAYVIYLRDSDEEWTPMDWCYYPNDLPIDKRLPVKGDVRYKDVWFTFNDEYSWSSSPVTVFKSIVKTGAR